MENIGHYCVSFEKYLWSTCKNYDITYMYLGQADKPIMPSSGEDL